MANLLSCFSDSFQNGDQESKEEENLRIFRSLSALESHSGKVVTARIKCISICLLYLTRKYIMMKDFIQDLLCIKFA